MRFFKARFFWAFVSAGVFLFGAAGIHSASARDARDIMSKVRARLDKIQSLSCSFDREHVWKAANRTQHIAGSIHMKKPYKLRVEYPAQTIVVDGKSAWTYTPRNRQTIVTKFKKSDAEYPTPQSIFSRYSHRTAEVIGREEIDGRAADILLLAAPSPDETEVTVWVDRALNFPVKTVEKHPSGDTTTSLLTDVVINGKIPDTTFTFTPPEGVSVVDMRK